MLTLKNMQPPSSPPDCDDLALFEAHQGAIFTHFCDCQMGNGNINLKRHLGIGLGVGGSILIVALSISIIWRRKKQKHTSTSFNSRNTSSDPSSRSEKEVGGVCFEVPIFSYSELAKATNNFSDEKVLGNGGFGTVYYAWPIRMKIAIETASALAYLHASDIIHRDVKTKNILLDNNFCVKVADFGLSRFFPADVTHVSTAPQGSPGYVDPEYYHCYQLTDRSDVYSFGVVLIELISSMPAVDKKRNRHEINLGYFAINRIQKGAIEELVDPRLGYQSNKEVRRMTTSVAELAFLCLQQNKEMRPPMDVVLDELKRIESGEWKLEDVKDNNDVLNGMEPPPDCDDLALLKHKRVSSSPISIAAKWVSSNTRLNVSY
ncbi:hypothetical protein Patl1_15114 [Pistacia atlantica]|uniref:Uncharacterized protein n=1 Tax=Pistacia atlantica TaxID=434234 RepID=A0ACC1B9K5_9ROSI|nr:hypothetical protein Patl1_15114 [Pistacia atlantica]